MFLEPINASYSKTKKKLFELLAKFVEKIGVKNMLQVVIDAATANIMADRPAKTFFN